MTVKEMRLHKNYSLEKAAELIGINKQHLYYIERSEREPSFEVIKKMAKAYNTTPVKIFSALV